MSGRDELLEALTVEKHTRIPDHRVLPAGFSSIATGGPDTPEAQAKRRADLLAETAPDRGPWREEDAELAAEDDA